eukprot:gb/GEZN01006182.1/.p1 GENE.gb/GEZN01006182.1/~~gb/GEZN01006182.1/.p1  ORF type:complete len:402 (+),score=59.69 gb/GEZN01006182.1/:58-1206(+)
MGDYQPLGENPVSSRVSLAAKIAGTLAVLSFGAFGLTATRTHEGAGWFGKVEEPKCVFIYAGATPKELTTKDVTAEAAVLSGARKTAISNFAVATGDKGDVVSGKLYCSNNKNFSEKLVAADLAAGYDPKTPEKGEVRRGISGIQKKDKSWVKTYWYFKLPSPIKTRNSDMTVAMFGCTGGTGLATVRKLLAKNNKITCLVRNVTKVPEDLSKNKNVVLVVGDALDKKAVTDTVRGSDAVVVVLGGRSKGKDATVCSESQPLINAALNQNNPDERMIVVTSMGVGSSYKHCSLLTKALVSTILRGAIDDKNKQEEMVQKQVKNYVFVRPGGLKDLPGTGKWKAAEDIPSGMIPREDVASFIVEEALGTDKWDKQGVTIVKAD